MLGAMARSVAERLRTFDRHVTELIGESVSRTTWEVHWTPRGITTVEPHREAFRSWLVAVRNLDAPSEDTYLPRIMDDIRTSTRVAVTRERIDALRVQYDDLQRTHLGEIAGVGEITARQCFEDLAYTEHLHRDADRARRRAAVAPLSWELMRLMGFDYGRVIGEIASWVQATGREDPDLGDLFAPLEPV